MGDAFSVPFILSCIGMNEWMNEWSFIANKPRENKEKKTKQINKIIEKEREIQKLIYSIKHKNYVT